MEEALLPDWFSEGSVPAKAISLLGLSKLLISPISAKITGAKLTPIPGTDKRWLSNLLYSSLISLLTSSIWFSKKIIWLISCLISKEQASVVNLIPKDSFATSFRWVAVSLLNLPLECLDNKLASFVVEIFKMSSGVGQLSNNCLEVVPKVSQKSFLYSGNTLSRIPITCVLREATLSTILLLKRAG